MPDSAQHWTEISTDAPASEGLEAFQSISGKAVTPSLTSGVFRGLRRFESGLSIDHMPRRRSPEILSRIRGLPLSKKLVFCHSKQAPIICLSLPLEWEQRQH